MTDYNRTIWKDHIKDQNGNVIQQGIPVSAKNLNNIENQLVILSAKENTLAELVREAIPSGFTTLSDLDYSYMSTNPNTIKLLKDSVAFINGYKVTIPAGTVIQLDAPPTSGSRDDLVFLECWKQADANGSVSWNWRIRVVDGVDFSKYPEGFHTNGTTWGSDQVAPQGGNAAQITTTSSNWALYNYNSAAPYGSRNWTATDVGLYVSGAGDSASKTLLNTTDGYVYSIPMFRVKRRNSGGYSVNNGNGAVPYLGVVFNNRVSKLIYYGDTTDATITSGNYSSLNVGDVFYYSSTYTYKVKIIALKGSNIVTIQLVNTPAYILDSGASAAVFKKIDRMDLLSADIIYERDITEDLRHQVSLTGFNYQALLEENFDKLIRGELQTKYKTQMLKTYHGIPKTPIDSNTVFYASFDGTTVAEVGGSPAAIAGTPSYGPAVTGLGLNTKATKINYGLNINSQVMTIDVFLSRKDELTDYSFYPVNILDRNSNLILCIDNKGNSMRFVMNGTTVLAVTPTLSKEATQHHLRLIVRDNSLTTSAYLDGKFIGNGSYTSPIINLIASIMVNNGSSASNSVVSDLSISNIDKGANFATLPQDFIDGYARIMQAFNEQRNVFSDALTSETEFVQVKCAGGNGRAIALGDVTDWAKDDGTKWNTGDRIKVKGISGEIISGVIDTDTAVARILNYTSPITVQLDDISKISVGDTLYFYKPDLSYSSAFSITAVDATAKTVTINATSNFESTWIGGYVFETTASSSSPKVQYYNGSTLIDVTGTWSGLGTNEATFTLGTNSSLTNQDLYITYGLNEIPGQGGISEVLTTTLAGESNGKKLTVNPSVHVRDDFSGKISGSVNINPNISKWSTSNNALIPPSYFTSESQATYDKMSILDGNSINMPTSSSGMIPQQLFSFNLIRILEDKFGTLPCGSDTASKIAWLKANLYTIKINWFGYGSCPGGNKAYIKPWRNDTSAWEGTYGATYNTSSSPSLLSPTLGISTGVTISQLIDSNGFVHMIAYTDASDGTTASVINTDYVNIEIMLNTPGNYDILVPENPRRDDGKSNILLIRKETKEIQSMFIRGNNDGIVTYGDYVPAQLLPYNTTSILFEPSYLIGTTAGTGSRGSIDSFNQYCNKSVFGQFIGVPNMYNFKNENIFDTNIAKIFNNDNKQNNFSFSKTIGWGIDKYSIILNTAIKNQVVNLLVLEIALINYNNELYIAVIGNTRIINADGSTSPSILNGNSNSTNVPMGIIKLNKRPLIK